MARGDYERWEARYASRDSSEMASVDPFLQELEPGLPISGRVLDVAGGTGRHAISLARRGLEVTLTDVSPRGLEIASAAGAEQGVRLTTVACDLDDEDLPPGPFDFIWCSWFLVSGTLWKKMEAVLAPGGWIAYVQPTLENLERHSRPSARFLAEPKVLEREIRDAGLVVSRSEVGWDVNENHTLRLIVRRGSGGGAA